MNAALGSSDIRKEESNVLKAVILSEKGISQQAASDYFGVSKSSLNRAKKATISDRDVGVNGRPSRLNAQQTRMFLELVKNAIDSQQELHYEELASIVSFFFFRDCQNRTI
jgi:transposase